MHTYNAIAIPDLIAMLECLPASEIQALNQAAHSETVPSEIPTSFESEIIMWLYNAFCDNLHERTKLGGVAVTRETKEQLQQNLKDLFVYFYVSLAKDARMIKVSEILKMSKVSKKIASMLDMLCMLEGIVPDGSYGFSLEAQSRN